MDKTNITSIHIVVGQGNNVRKNQAYVDEALDLNKISTGEQGLRYYITKFGNKVRAIKWLVIKQIDVNTWLIEMMCNNFRLICINDTPIMLIITDAFNNSELNVYVRGIENAKDKMKSTIANRSNIDHAINEALTMEDTTSDDLWLVQYIRNKYNRKMVKNTWIKGASFYSDYTYSKSVDIYSVNLDNGQVNILVNFSSLKLQHGIDFYAIRNIVYSYLLTEKIRDKLAENWINTQIPKDSNEYIIVGLKNKYTSKVDDIIIDLNNDTILSIYCKLYIYFEGKEYSKHIRYNNGRILQQSFGRCIRIEDRDLGYFNVLKVGFDLSDRLEHIKLITAEGEDNIKDKLMILNMGKTQDPSEDIKDKKNDRLHITYNCKESCNILCAREARTIKDSGEAQEIFENN